MIIKKINSRLGEKLFFLIVLLYIINTAFTGCKKEDHSEHDIPHDEVGVPYLPYAVYVADEEDESITVIDPIANVKIGSIMLGDHSNSSLMLIPHNVQVAPDGKTIWVTGTAHDSGGMEQVIVIDPVANHSIIKRINIGTNQHLAHVVLDSTSTYAYVTANESNEVVKIDAKTYTEVNRFNLNAAHRPHGLRYS
ncbi:MAG: YncE family protein, partial [Bacteroidia bacterium]